MDKKRVHAFSDDVLADHDATALARLIADRQISPKEAVEAAIARAEQVDGRLRGIETPLFARALETARADIGPGAFAGVPSLVKDNTDLAGVPTRHGSRAVVNPPPARRHGTFARQYLDQGFTVLGKSRLPEFGFSPTTEFEDEPPTRNPWNTDHSSGASSGGAAVLVAAGVVPIAHANDGGGSIRIPAACCGLVGLKPGRGRLVDGEAARSLPINIIGEGVVTRSVRDTARFFHAAEQYYRNPKLPPVGQVEGPGRRRLRIGLVLDSVTGHPTDEQTRRIVMEVARELETHGHAVEEITAPVTRDFERDFLIYYGMLAWMITTFGKRIMSPEFNRRRVDGLTAGLRRHYVKNAWRTPGVLARARGARLHYSRTFSDHDVVLSPVLGHGPPELGYLRPDQPWETLVDRLVGYAGFTPLNNLTGSPAISVPGGRNRQGLPIGVHLSAAHGDERTLLELAFELEQSRSWPQLSSSAMAVETAGES